MKVDEDMVTFIQRWRTLAARSSCALSEHEQIQMIVQNTLPHIHSWITITGCPTNLTQLYQRGTEVQSALKDPTFQLYASRSKQTRKDQGPITEGVTINEQIGLVNQRPNPSQPTARTNQPRPAYNQTPPPNNYAPRRGPRRNEYPPLPEKLEDIFKILLEFNLVTLPKPYDSPPAHWDRSKYCHFHRGPGHNTNTCYHFRDLVYDMNDRGEILWAEVRKHLQKGQNNKPQPRPQADLGIVQNPLPNHPPAQAPPPPPPAREPGPPPVAAPQAAQENVQRISTIVPVGPRRVIARSQTWSIDGEPSIPISQATKFTHGLTVPPVIYMVEPESEPQDDRPDLVIPTAVPPQF